MPQTDRQSQIEGKVLNSPFAGGNVIAVLQRLRKAFSDGLSEFEAVAYGLFGYHISEGTASATEKGVISSIIGYAVGGQDSQNPNSVEALKAKAAEAEKELYGAIGRAQADGSIPAGLSIDSMSGKSSFDWLTQQGFITVLGLLLIVVAIYIFRENS